jgi:uncharacterized protein (UPF0332 family)
VTATGRDEEIQANWHRAQDSLAAAQVLLDTGHPDVAAARAYYAAFYAACALLLWQGKEFSKHTGVQAAIHKDFVNTGLLAEEHGRAFGRLFDLRGIGDYGETQHVAESEARQAVLSARMFVEACGQVLRNSGFNTAR